MEATYTYANAFAAMQLAVQSQMCVRESTPARLLVFLLLITHHNRTHCAMTATAWALALVLLTLYAVPAAASSPSHLSAVLSGTSGGFQMHVISLLQRNKLHEHGVTDGYPDLTVQEFEKRVHIEKRKWDLLRMAISADQSVVPHLVGYAVAGATVLVAFVGLLHFVSMILTGHSLVMLPMLCSGLVIFGVVVSAAFVLIEVTLMTHDADAWQATGWSVVMGHMCDPTKLFHVPTLTRDLYSDKTLHDLLDVSAEQ